MHKIHIFFLLCGSVMISKPCLIKTVSLYTGIADDILSGTFAGILSLCILSKKCLFKAHLEASF